MNDLLSCIKEHEGLRLSCYKDSLGFDTIGYGKCIDKRKSCGITEEEAAHLLENDVFSCESQLKVYSWWLDLDRVRQDVFVELCFNIGLESLLKFNTLISLVKEKKYKEASDDLLGTLWAKEVGSIRSNNMANRLATGCY